MYLSLSFNRLKDGVTKEKKILFFSDPLHRSRILMTKTMLLSKTVILRKTTYSTRVGTISWDLNQVLSCLYIKALISYKFWNGNAAQ